MVERWYQSSLDTDRLLVNRDTQSYMDHFSIRYVQAAAYFVEALEMKGRVADRTCTAQQFAGPNGTNFACKL